MGKTGLRVRRSGGRDQSPTQMSRIILLTLSCCIGSSQAILSLLGTELMVCPDAGSSINQKCQEPGGGVHAICIEDIPKDFSSSTGQSPWSARLNGRHHCVCLGAWSLYVKMGNKPKVKCDATPEFVFEESYTSHWSKWNGLEKDKQYVQGVNHMYKRCREEAGDNEEMIEHLKAKYDAMTSQWTDTDKLALM